jgi:signal peptidase I
MRLALNTYNLPMYERIIRVYEHNKLVVKGNEFYINDKPAKTYTFKMDYYWMMGDNRHNSADSRYWGFVPEDHIVGRPVLVWLSLNKDKGWFDGKIRWNRFFKKAEK